MHVQTNAPLYSAPTAEAIREYYEALRPFWHPVLPAADLPASEPRPTELLNQPLVIVRLNGKLVAMEDVCRHFQAQLSLGEIREVAGYGDCLMCPYHGWSFAPNGQCVDIPQMEPGRDIPTSARVPTYHVQERYGLIWVCLADEPRFDLPTLPRVDDPEFLTGPLRTYEPWVAAAPRVIMAALDDTHGPWVHEGLVGSREHAAPPEHRVWREGNVMKVDIQMVQPNNATIAESDQDASTREVHLTTTVAIPNVIHFDITAADSTDGRHTLIWQAVCPRQFNKTDTFWGSSRNYDHDQPVYDEDFEAMQDTLRDQDRRIVESQRPWLLPPFWTKIELPLRPADLPLIEYQRWLEELGITIAV
ncbi:MAG: aromatic ring-hydroxylating dioxygenase subunit alpha [Anaerolineae bacterium]|nr:aromatic ring-hydroxylating dioxygenase subunit alpha [Anaerolineae bacterium]